MADTTAQIPAIVEELASAFDGIVFTLLAGLGARAWLRSRSAVDAWFTGIFLTLAIVVGIGFVIGEETEPSVLGRVSVALLALMPLCLYRFTRAFARGSRVVDIVSIALTVTVVAMSLSIAVPADREEWSGLVSAFVALFLVHWTVLSIASAWFFIREAQRSPGVAARRMRLFAGATLVLASALLLSGIGARDEQTVAQAALAFSVQLAGAASALLFLLALAPPRALRATWRLRELDQVEGGLLQLLDLEHVATVRARALELVVRLTGAAGAVFLDRAGEPVASCGIADADAATFVSRAAMPLVPHETPGSVTQVGRLVVATGAAAPFFGREERQLLATISEFATMAEQRASVLERERSASQRLREVDQLKTEFVAMVAHDLRSPMSVITGFADTIHDRWDDLADDKKLEYLRLISRNARSLSEFVEDVLRVARMEAGEFTYEMRPFDPREVVQRIVSEMRVAHPELTLTVDAPSQLPVALGDSERNWQILNNLVSNALKFSEGETSIEVELRELPDERAVAIAVRDHGVGISTEDQERLFRRFSRVGPTRRTVAGSGLGLYIVKSMVEAQGGRIWVESAPGEGATFTYTMPIATLTPVS
ncbi:MAG: multi-sensor signal transduction histidine kinase [Thermoleophilia bacterium]|nr:multi-sensor signal transduction histidine kinase [Thermoleophilia bacterium]